MYFNTQFTNELRQVYGTALKTNTPNLFGESTGTVLSRAEASLRTKSAATVQVVEQYSLQRKLRPLFGKTGINPPRLGHHPDFEHLKGTDGEEYHPTTTLFMDLESSTRMGAIYPPKDVKKIKNTFLSAAIEVISAFDGHPHRLMGDAVLAFFGRRGMKHSEQGIIDALNCAAVLIWFVKMVVIPKLEEEYPDTQFGVRIGIDYGERDEVLWSSYGYPEQCEVTATSLKVDLASKLQHLAGRNKIMIGESLRKKIGLDDNLLDLKTRMKDGKPEEVRFVEPNITLRDGSPLNYQMYVLRDEEYLLSSPLAAQAPELYYNDEGPRLRPLKVKAAVNGSEIISSGTPVLKNRSIHFKTTPPPGIDYRTTAVEVRFIVENHGEEASKVPNYSNHQIRHQFLSESDFARYTHSETTGYLGLHWLIVEISQGGVVTHRTRFGVYVI